MDPLTVLPDKAIVDSGEVSAEFLKLGIQDYLEACRFVLDLPYGYNSDRDDLMILFKERMGNCTTKHAVIATLAGELRLPVEKNIGIYPMTEEIVTGTDQILEEFGLPYVPMVHCFLVYQDYKVDLTEGNNNGKNRPIDEFLHTEKVSPNISGKEEYLLYRKALKALILSRPELKDTEIRTMLRAHEKGLRLLKTSLHP